MKKLLLILVFVLMACEEKKDEELSPFIGTWAVTEKGVYQVSDCSGEVDDSEWRGLKSKGVTITIEIKKDGTGVETITGPDPKVTTFTWYNPGNTFCMKDDCFIYVMPNNQQSFYTNIIKDPYCIDENYKVTGHNTQRDCEDASTSNLWVKKKCHKTRYVKQ